MSFKIAAIEIQMEKDAAQPTSSGKMQDHLPPGPRTEIIIVDLEK